MADNESDVKKIITRFLEHLAAGDADGMAEFFAEEIDWFVPGSKDLPWTGHRSARADVPLYFKTMWPHFASGKSESIPEKLLISGQDAVLFARFVHVAASTGRRFETEVVLHFTLADGKIVRMHLYEDTLAVRDAFKPLPGPD